MFDRAKIKVGSLVRLWAGTSQPRQSKHKICAKESNRLLVVDGYLRQVVLPSCLRLWLASAKQLVTYLVSNQLVAG